MLINKFKNETRFLLTFELSMSACTRFILYRLACMVPISKI